MRILIMKLASVFLSFIFISSAPVDTERKLHKTFRRRPGHLLNVSCTFNLRPVSTGAVKSYSKSTRVTAEPHFPCHYGLH